MGETEKKVNTMSFERFLHQIKMGYDAGNRYCFILGSGASKKSGIPTGIELIQKWRDELKGRDKELLIEIMKAVQIDPKRFDELFREDYEVNSTDYFDFFDMRFEGVPAAAYKELQSLMSKSNASFGYYAMAALLNETENRVVITTNFDSLVEDSLFVYCAKHPLVVGHESLASYISATENRERPIVAKVHRDLLYKPLNRKKEMDKLAENWREPLTTVLSKYIPIVIGYAGGDQTLMGLLSKIKLEGIYWCHYDGKLDQQVEELLSDKPGRYKVELKGKGFDRVMYELIRVLRPEFDLGSISNNIKTAATQRADNFDQQCQEFIDSERSKRVPEPVRSASAPPSAPKDAPGESEAEQKPLEQLSMTSLELMDMEACKNGKYERSLEICNEIVRREPDKAEHWFSRGLTFSIMNRDKKALSDKTKAIELAPDNAKYWNSRGRTLEVMGRYEEALADAKKAVELAPETAEYWSFRGLTFNAMGRYEEALADAKKAVELAPENKAYQSFLQRLLERVKA